MPQLHFVVLARLANGVLVTSVSSFQRLLKAASTCLKTGWATALARRALTTASAADRRVVVAIAGVPGSGKSTTSREVCRRLNAAEDQAVVVPMDGARPAWQACAHMRSCTSCWQRSPALDAAAARLRSAGCALWAASVRTGCPTASAMYSPASCSTCLSQHHLRSWCNCLSDACKLQGSACARVSPVPARAGCHAGPRAGACAARRALDIQRRRFRHVFARCAGAGCAACACMRQEHRILTGHLFDAPGAALACRQRFHILNTLLLSLQAVEQV